MYNLVNYTINEECTLKNISTGFLYFLLQFLLQLLKYNEKLYHRLKMKILYKVDYLGNLKENEIL